MDEIWDDNKFKIVRTTIEFESGLIRELNGEESDAWHRAQWKGRHGIKQDFTQFKWKESHPQDNKKD